jgi:signal peptidase II
MWKPKSGQAQWILPALILFSCIGCDQWTKRIAVERFQRAPAMSFFGDTLRIQYAENPGAFLGAGKDLPQTQRFWILVVVNSVFVVGFAAVAFVKGSFGRMQTLAITLFLAGGIGNLIDRIFHDGLVIDFLNMGIGPVRTGIFNVADVAIMAAFGLLLLQPGPKSQSPEPLPQQTTVAEAAAGLESQ